MRLSNLIKKITTIALAALIMFSGVIATPQTADAATIKAKLHIGSLWYYDGSRANTFHKYVTFKLNGKSYERDAYCLHPSRGVPGAGTYTAKSVSNTNDLARVMYFAKDAPGEDLLKDYMTDKGYSSYVKSRSQFYCFMHILTAYAHIGNKAFNIYGGGKLSSKYQGAVKKAYSYCTSYANTTDATFDVRYKDSAGKTHSTVTAVFNPAKNVYTTASTKFYMSTSNKNQYFTTTVPKYTTLYVKKSGASTYKAYAGGTEGVKIGQGAYFYYEIDATKKSTGFERKVTGKIKDVDAYSMTTSSSLQSIGFFATSTAKTDTFKVNVPEIKQGKVKIYKATESVSGVIKAEPNAVFKVYNKTYGSYDAAVKHNNSIIKYAQTLTTGADGTAISGNLYADSSTSPKNVYVVEQVSSKTGYKVAAKREVTVTSGKTTAVKDSGKNYIINKQIPLNLKVVKKAEGTNTPLAGVKYKFYTDIDGTVEAKTASGTAIGEKTTDSNGAININGLNEGVYYAKETATIDGYVLDASLKKITVSYANATYNSSTQAYELKAEFTNKKETTHDLFLTKQTSGALWDDFWEAVDSSVSSGSTFLENNTSLKTEAFTFTVKLTGLKANTTYTYYNTIGYNKTSTSSTDNGINSPDMYGSSGIKTFTADSSGKATVTDTIKLPSNVAAIPNTLLLNHCIGGIWFEGLPSTAKYTITEDGANYLGNSASPYTPSYTAKVYESDSFANGISDSQTADPGKSIATGEKSFPTLSSSFPEDYGAYYTFCNDASVTHKYIIEKKVDGVGASTEEDFDFEINIVAPGINNGEKLSYVIYSYNEYGEKIVAKSGVPQATPGSNLGDYYIRIKLKANQIFELSGIKEGTIVTTYENESDYKPSFKGYEYAAGEKQPDETFDDIEGTANNGLATAGDPFYYGATKQMIIKYEFTNTAPKTPKYNSLVLKKETNTAGTTDEFSFDVNLSGVADAQLAPYAIIKPGSNKLTMSTDGTLISTTQGTSNTAIGGMCLTFTRSDGRTKTVRTDSNGTLNFEQKVVANWIRQKGSSNFTITWIGGTVNASLDSSGKVVMDTVETAAKYEVVATSLDDTLTKTITLKKGENARIDGLPENSSYNIAEHRSAYTPSYTVIRHNGDTSKELMSDAGLTTNDGDAITFDDGAKYTDVVTFTNKKTGNNLQVNKSTSDSTTTDSFDYTAQLSRLNDSSYVAVVPGDGTFDITIGTTGTLMIKQTAGTSISLEGIPIKITRPDDDTMIAKTNSSGEVAASEYVDWLTEGQTESFDFIVDFLGTEVEMTCSM